MTDLVNNQNSIDLILSEDKLNDYEYINEKLLEVKLSVLHQLSRGNNEKFKNLIVEHAYDLLCIKRMKVNKINSLLKEFKMTYDDFSQNDKDKYLTVYKEFIQLNHNNPLKAEEFSEKSQVYMSLQNDKLNLDINENEENEKKENEKKKNEENNSNVNETKKTKKTEKRKKVKKKKIIVKKKIEKKNNKNINEDKIDKDYLDQIKKDLEI